MSLRIGFDAGLFPAADRGGLARYRRELLEALLADPGGHRFVVYGRKLHEWLEAGDVVELREAPTGSPLGGMGMYRQWWLPRQASCDRVDVLHHPLGSGPLRPGPPAVVSVHDMLCVRGAALDYPVPLRGLRFRARKRYHRMLVPATLRRARRVIASSEATRDDVVAMARVPADRVTVVPLAISRAFADGGEGQEPERLGLEPGYVLAFSSVDPRKNTHRVIEAHARLPEELAGRHPLVVVLTQDTHRRSLEVAAKRGGRAVRFLPYLEEAELPRVYRGAAILAYPSLFEGFGLPVLEAMELGLPVLAAKVGGVPEVAGDAAQWVDPRCISSIATGMEALLADAGLRARRIAAGREQARRFNWARTARETLRVYEEAGH